MKKVNIIKKNHEFQTIIQLKKQTINRYIVAYVRKNKTSLRVGISISKKFTNAVGRNRQKRQVRHVLDAINLWSIKKDVVLILRKPFLIASFEVKIKEIKKILERI